MAASTLKHSLPLSTLLQQQQRFVKLPLRQLQGLRYMQSPSPVFASGADVSSLQALLGQLVKPTGQWDISATGRGIERTYKFKTFKAAWSFMSQVAEQCKSARHHPEWSNVYSSVFVRWTTHHPPGLTNKDAEMAGFCDKVASTGGSSDAESSAAQQEDADRLKEMANGAVDKNGGCCGQPDKEEAKQKEKEKIEKEETEEGGQGSVAGIGGQPS